MMGMYRFAYEPEVHITRYAAAHHSEDFAEVFGMWVKYGGRIPKKWATPGIKKRWRFVGQLRKVVGAGLRRW
jgi:hypothetical protein